MARTLPLCAIALVLALAGCGDTSPPRAHTSVQLTLTDPGDGASVRDASVTLHGTVQPAEATVLVRGHRVAVSGGSFSATVGLEAGTNVIDVLASAPDARPAMTALRVKRLVTVRVPDVAGDDPDQAKERLAGLGLSTEVDDTGGVFEVLLPGDPVVCTSDPSPGTEVDPGTTVTLTVSKEC